MDGHHMPTPAKTRTWKAVFVGIATIGIALVAMLTTVNLLSTRSFGEFEFWFSSIKIAAT